MAGLLLRLLPDARDRRVLAAYLFDGATQQEIADAEGCPQTTVSSWLRRMLRTLRSAGFPVSRPARRTDPRAEHLAPDRLACLTVDGPYRTGVVARWVDSPRVEPSVVAYRARRDRRRRPDRPRKE